MSDNGNGENKSSLPESRKAAVIQAAEYYQEEHQRNEDLTREVAHLKTELAGYRVTVEVLQAQVNEAVSKAETALLQAKQHEAARIEYEALYVAVLQLFRAFKIPHAPLVRELVEQQQGVANQGGA